MQVKLPKAEKGQATSDTREALAKIEEWDLEGSGNDSPTQNSIAGSRLQPPSTVFYEEDSPLAGLDADPSSDARFGQNISFPSTEDANGPMTALAFSHNSLTAQRNLRYVLDLLL